jgi:translation elongation factor EF-Ts
VKAGSSSIGEAVASAIATIGENMTFPPRRRHFGRRGRRCAIHARRDLDGLGKIGVLVAWSKGDATSSTGSAAWSR